MAISNDTRVNSALRLAAGYTVSGITAIAALGFIPQDQAAALIQAIHDFNDGVQQVVGALGKMWIIIGPTALVILAKFGIQTNSLQAIIGKLLAKSQENTPEAVQAQAALVSATQQIANDPTALSIEAAKTLINATANVASAPMAALSHDAKVALLDAVASQPEVVGQIKVTDANLERDTNSAQVVKAAA